MEAKIQTKDEKTHKISENFSLHKNCELTASQSPFLRVNIGTPPVAVRHMKCNDIFACILDILGNFASSPSHKFEMHTL